MAVARKAATSCAGLSSGLSCGVEANPEPPKEVLWQSCLCFNEPVEVQLGNLAQITQIHTRRLGLGIESEHSMYATKEISSTGISGLKMSERYPSMLK